MIRYSRSWEGPMPESFIYLDNNATTPLLPEVADAMSEIMAIPYGNPSSPHSVGYASRNLIETARSQVSDLINTIPEHLIFTSCGSEANNQAILSALSTSGLNRIDLTRGRLWKRLFNLRNGMR
jgi:cysteine desulfurase